MCTSYRYSGNCRFLVRVDPDMFVLLQNENKFDNKLVEDLRYKKGSKIRIVSWFTAASDPGFWQSSRKNNARDK